MIRKAALLLLGALAVLPARASMEDDGVWKAGVWATTAWADGVWYEQAGDPCPMCVPVPSVIGQASAAAADTILEGDGLDLGATAARCSDATADEVVAQSPPPGTEVELGSLVDVFVSNGELCPSGKPGVRLRGMRMRGL